jgi:hypothetical protein
MISERLKAIYERQTLKNVIFNEIVVTAVFSLL